MKNIIALTVIAIFGSFFTNKAVINYTTASNTYRENFEAEGFTNYANIFDRDGDKSFRKLSEKICGTVHGKLGKPQTIESEPEEKNGDIVYIKIPIAYSDYAISTCELKDKHRYLIMKRDFPTNETGIEECVEYSKPEDCLPTNEKGKSQIDEITQSSNNVYNDGQVESRDNGFTRIFIRRDIMNEFPK